MRVLRNMLMALMALMLCSAFTLKEKKGEGVFLFGIAASFNDSVVYFTPIQRVDSVKLENGFLPKRAQYAYQLKNQIEVAQGKSDYTCMIYFAETKAKLEKEVAKVKGKYVKSQLHLEEIPAETFTFRKPSDEE
ncbi:MAG: hypothetical protein ACI38V_04850 [Bacteroides sp.]